MWTPVTLLSTSSFKQSAFNDRLSFACQTRLILLLSLLFQLLWLRGRLSVSSCWGFGCQAVWRGCRSEESASSSRTHWKMVVVQLASLVLPCTHIHLDWYNRSAMEDESVVPIVAPFTRQCQTGNARAHACYYDKYIENINMACFFWQNKRNGHLLSC